MLSRLSFATSIALAFLLENRLGIGKREGPAHAAPGPISVEAVAAQRAISKPS